MSNKIVLIKNNLSDLNFSSTFTYKTLFYIIVNYDKLEYTIKLNNRILIKEFNVSDYTCRKIKKELLKVGVIIKHSFKKDYYVINKKFIKSFNDCLF